MGSYTTPFMDRDTGFRFLDYVESRDTDQPGTPMELQMHVTKAEDGLGSVTLFSDRLTEEDIKYFAAFFNMRAYVIKEMPIQAAQRLMDYINPYVGAAGLENTTVTAEATDSKNCKVIITGPLSTEDILYIESFQ